MQDKLRCCFDKEMQQQQQQQQQQSLMLLDEVVYMDRMTSSQLKIKASRILLSMRSPLMTSSNAFFGLLLLLYHKTKNHAICSFD